MHQFQAFIQFRGKLKSRSSEEIQMLKEKPMVWNIHSILNVLYSLVEKSNINAQVSGEAQLYQSTSLVLYGIMGMD